MVVTYDPRLPNMSAVLQKHFKTLTSDQHMKEVFGKGMQVAHKRYRNVREFVCRAKLYEKQDRRNPSRAAHGGWRRCNRCTTCLHSENKTHFVISSTKEKVPIAQNLNCKICGTLYVVECQRCQEKPQYIGKTRRSLMVRGREHIYNVDHRKAEGRATSKLYAHFSTNGHTSKDMLFYAIEQVYGDEFTLQSRERYFIDKAGTIKKGLNTYRT